MTTTANGGASAGSGSIALSAQVAITISNVTTSAIGRHGPDLTLTGGLTAHATQTAIDDDDRLGATKGGNASDRPLARARRRQPPRRLAARAQPHRRRRGQLHRRRLVDERHRGDGELRRRPGQEGRTGLGRRRRTRRTARRHVNEQGRQEPRARERHVDERPAARSSGTRSTPAAKSGEGGGTTVTVAAAVAIAIVTANAISGIADGLTLTTPTGAVELRHDRGHRLDGEGERQRDEGQPANIGAAVAINLITVHERGDARHRRPDRLERPDARRPRCAAPAAPTGRTRFDTEATAGAGNGKVGIAGSLALDDRRRRDERRDQVELGPRAARRQAQRKRPHPVRHLVRLQHGQGDGEGHGRGHGRYRRRRCDQHRQRHDHRLDRRRCADLDAEAVERQRSRRPTATRRRPTPRQARPAQRLRRSRSPPTPRSRCRR